jgi:hypothetical protein
VAVPTRTDGWYPRSFLLTDIVDSVSLWERGPDPMAQAVARHEATISREVVADQLPEAVRLLYRGRRVLRGIKRPEEVWELGPADDPRLTSPMSVGVRGPPVALTRFVGQKADLNQLAEIVGHERLVRPTGTGPAFVGLRRRTPPGRG